MFCEGNTLRRLRVARQRRGVPNADRLIVACRREPVAVGTECHAGDEAVVGVDRKHLAAGCAVQQPDGAVKTGHGDSLAVRAEGDGAALVRVALLVDLELPRGRVPDLDEAIQARPGKSPRIRTEPAHVNGYARSSLRNENVSRPVSRSQTLTVPSSQAASTDRPSGRNATPLTAAGCAENHLERLSAGHIPQAHAAIRAT